MPLTITLSDEDCETVRYGFTDIAVALVIGKLDAAERALERVDISGMAPTETCACGEPGTIGVIHRPEPHPCYWPQRCESCGHRSNHYPNCRYYAKSPAHPDAIAYGIRGH